MAKQAMAARDKVSAARFGGLRRLPYMPRSLMVLRPVETTIIPTMAVDAGLRLYYNPEWIVKQEGQKLIGVLLHEAFHVAMMDCVKGKGLLPREWNLATDARINAILRAAGIDLPEGCVYPETLDLPAEGTAKQYYAILIGRHKAGDAPSKGEEGEGKGGEPIPGDGASCGSVAGTPDGDGTGKSLEQRAREAGAEVPEAQDDAAKENVARATMDAIAKHPGSVPGALKAWAQEMLAPEPVPWDRILSAKLRRMVQSRAGRGESSWRVPSRRPMPPCLTAGEVKPVPSIGLVLDVSGSMRGAAEKEARAQIIAVVKALGETVRVVAWDTQAAARGTVRGAKDLARLGTTGGGTDLAPACLEWASRKVDVCLVLTDGETPWPDKSRMGRTRLVACVVGEAEVPAWIETVRVTGKE